MKKVSQKTKFRVTRTRETIEIAASKVPAFKASSTLKDAVNK